MTRSGSAKRRLGGLVIVGVGLLVAATVAVALILTDVRLAALMPPDRRSAFLETAISSSLAWAGGTGAAFLVLGLGVWWSGRAR